MIRPPRPIMTAAWLLGVLLVATGAGPDERPDVVDATSMRGKVLCGYQGWFRCPGDPAGMGWVHWSRNSRRIAPETLTFEMWPDLSEHAPEERYPAPGFSYPDGKPAELFSSDNAATVLRHFTWMRDHGIDGAWLQQFVVELASGPSRSRVREHVAEAARKTGRAWAITYDLSGMPADRAFDRLTADWKGLVDEKMTDDSRYLNQDGRPVVMLWGFYADRMTPDQARKLIAFFKSEGPYSAYLVGGGDWNWRKNSDPPWAEVFRSFDAYAPWNVGNTSRDDSGVRHAAMRTWAEDKQDCERRGTLWLPVVYPGFGWDNLKRRPAGSTRVPRRGGQFLWEQFHELARLGADSVFVAMFDEVDEGTAIFKVTNSPPTEAHFVGYEGLPSDWYLRLVGEGGKMLRGQRLITSEIPIKP